MWHFFSGAARWEDRLAMNADQLFAQHSERGPIRAAIQYKKDHPECKSRIMIDSGAFSAYTKGDKIDVDDYIKFVNEEIGPYIELFVTVDTIGDPNAANNDKCTEATWENWLYMWDRIKPEFRSKMCIVFHQGDKWHYLDRILDWRSPEGGKVNWIGVGISIEAKNQNRLAWGRQMFEIIKAHHREDIHTHAFGCSVPSILKELPLTSADSTSYLKTAAFGGIFLNNKVIPISEQAVHRPDHFTSLSPELQAQLTKIIESRGFTVEGLKTSNYERMKFNVDDTRRWVEAINHDTIDTNKGVKKLW